MKKLIVKQESDLQSIFFFSPKNSLKTKMPIFSKNLKSIYQAKSWKTLFQWKIISQPLHHIRSHSIKVKPLHFTSCGAQS
jgi:hypothetical protein